jgi:hypothetical protein
MRKTLWRIFNASFLLTSIFGWLASEWFFSLNLGHLTVPCWVLFLFGSHFFINGLILGVAPWSKETSCKTTSRLFGGDKDDHPYRSLADVPNYPGVDEEKLSPEDELYEMLMNYDWVFEKDYKWFVTKKWWGTRFRLFDSGRLDLLKTFSSAKIEDFPNNKGEQLYKELYENLVLGKDQLSVSDVLRKLKKRK